MYIDRTRVIETIRGQHCASCPGLTNSDYADCDVCSIQSCINAIKLMPEENVEPTKGEAHRFWNFAEYGTMYVCSECHSPVLHKDQSYCAFCGRKMSKEVEEI